MRKFGVLLSGGVDSTVALAALAERIGADPNAQATGIFVDYGQRTRDAEERAVGLLGFRYWARIYRIEAKGMFDKGSPLLDHKKLISNWQDAELPYRNGILLSLGASVMLSLGGGELWHGIHPSYEGDIAYADTSQEFLFKQGESIWAGTAGRVLLVSPFFTSKSKKETILKGEGMRVPWKMTHTCFVSNEEQCGICPTCIQRKKAFKEAGVVDPKGYRVTSKA